MRVVRLVAEVLIEGVTGVVIEDDLAGPVALSATEVRNEPGRSPARRHH
jgi:hypothetical protein